MENSALARTKLGLYRRKITAMLRRRALHFAASSIRLDVFPQAVASRRCMADKLGVKRGHADVERITEEIF